MMPTDAAARDFALPDLGEGLEDAVLVEWHVQVGDVIVLNQPLCTVETAKATVEIPSPYAGHVVDRVGQPGETIAVGALLVRIAEASSTSASPPAELSAPTRAPTLVGYGPEIGPSRRRRRSSHAPGPSRPGSAAPTSTGGGVLAKPPVRKLARELGVDLATVAPSGAGGVVTRDDITGAAASGGDPAQVEEPEPPRLAWTAVTPVQPGGVIPVVGVRARIAEHMTRSRASIPDASCSVTADCKRLLDVRDALREVAQQRADADVLTPFALVLRIVVAALRARPILNATFDADARQIVVHEAIHLGVGVDTPRGLMVPVIRDAEARSTIDLAIEMRRLAAGARAESLTPAELVGSTFTVSNFGVFGLDEGVPVINAPNVAIVGVGAIKERASVVGGQVVARPMVHLTCSFDHRACDGADAGAFLGRLRDLIESPEQLILET